MYLIYRIDSSFVIKVADFGLSESIYVKNYFKEKGGSVKLPIKWMALESLTDGVFSEASDVVCGCDSRYIFFQKLISHKFLEKVIEQRLLPLLRLVLPEEGVWTQALLKSCLILLKTVGTITQQISEFIHQKM